MSSTQCAATTEAGVQCSRTAKIDGYCTQHYKILFSDISGDVMKNVVSDYINYNELEELKENIENLHINPKRKEVTKIEIKNEEEYDHFSDEIDIFYVGSNEVNKLFDIAIEDGKNFYILETKIDGIIRKKEAYIDNIKRLDLNFDDSHEYEGTQTAYYENGQIWIIAYYVGGKKIIKEFYEGGNIKFFYETYLIDVIDNDTKIKVDYDTFKNYYSNGLIRSEVVTINDRQAYEKRWDENGKLLWVFKDGEMTQQ